MATITEDYVSFETAKLLKEKGFHEDCKCQYGRGGSISWTSSNNGNVTTFARPTLQMTIKWLREVHNTFISIIYENDGIFVANLKSPLKGVDCMIDDKHNCWFTYEEACEAAIKYCLKNVI